MMIWEYYDIYKPYIKNFNPGWQHEYMADYYIEYMAEGLKKLHPELSSQKFIDFGNSVYSVDDSPFSWDDFFYYTAWEGLQKTENFQKEIVDKGKFKKYNFYLTLPGQESQSNKCN